MNDGLPIPETIRWTDDGAGLLILDQTRLPGERVERELRELEDIEEAIQSLRVRGAPLIGITGAMGLAALARREVRDSSPTIEQLAARLIPWANRLAAARPTAVNLVWAIERMRTASRPRSDETAAALAERLVLEATAILEEDRRMCRRIGEHAVILLQDGASVITHCNAGALATGGIGTALAPIYVGVERGLKLRVFADETRPLLQGSRLTAWELSQAGVDVTVISDNMAGALFAQEPPDIVFVGSDRIAANGDVANKVGTYGLAVIARHHRVPFYVLAPTSTVDLDTATGGEIPIEHRSPDEIRHGFGAPTAPEEAAVWSPAFDITPAELIAGIVTEQGIHRPPYEESLADAVTRASEERDLAAT
jgi:methylthioribose-1-phosphate isomerase